MFRPPACLDALTRRWSLTLGSPFDPSDGGAWVAPATRSDGTPAVLKIAMPHMEARHEIEGLRFWNGNPTVRLLESDDELWAMLLERCVPGTPLKSLPESDQDAVVAGLLRRLWRVPDPPHPFRPLSAMIEHWRRETLSQSASWVDAGLVREGLRLFEEL